MREAVRNAALPFIGRALSRPRTGDSQSILIMQPDHLGDILLSQPAVRWIRERYQDAFLTAVVGPWSEGAARRFWPVDNVISVEYPGFKRAGPGRPYDPYTGLRSAVNQLKGLHAGRAVVLRPDAWWAAWLAATVVPEVVGSDDPRVRPFTSAAVPVTDSAHAAVRAWEIAAGLDPTTDTAAPSPESAPIWISPSSTEIRAAEALLAKHKIAGPYVIVHVGSGAPVKEWPICRWRIVIATLTRDGLGVVCTGTRDEQRVVTELIEGIPNAHSIAGETDLGTLIAVLSHAVIALGPDSGPLHLAVATGTPTIHLFGPSDDVRYGPWGNPARHHVISAGMTCHRCGDLSLERLAGCGCMLGIQTGDVIAEARSMIENVDS